MPIVSTSATVVSGENQALIDALERAGQFAVEQAVAEGIMDPKIILQRKLEAFQVVLGIDG